MHLKATTTITSTSTTTKTMSIPCLAFLLLMPFQLLPTEAKFFLKKWTIFSPSKSDAEPELSLPEKLALGTSRLADGTSKFVQSSIFLLSGLVTGVYLIRHLFMTSKEAAIEEGLVERMLKAEGEAAASVQRLLAMQHTAPPTHHSRLVRFVGQNYYTILVLFAFLNVCLVLCLCHLKFRKPEEKGIKRRKRKRIRR